jgi:heat-inducible transcriptional repressor
MLDRQHSALTPRQARILCAVCRDYVVQGKEVSSAALVRTHGLHWSPATVRSELAVLERGGFLMRSHHSAGRRPTHKGLEYYVETLRAMAPPRALVEAVDHSLRNVDAHPDAGMRAAVRVLSEVAGCVAVSFYGSAHPGIIRGLDIVPLVSPRALVVLEMGTATRSLHPVTLERSTGEEDFGTALLGLRQRLRALCLGRTLAEARTEFLRLQSEHEARFDRVLCAALQVGLALCGGSWLDPLWLQVAGKGALARELSGADQLGEVLSLLEDTQRLAEVLCQVLPDPSEGHRVRAEVRVGAEGLLHGEAGGSSASDRSAVLSGLALVGCRLPAASCDGVRKGAVALLGSDRMDYAAVIPLVEYAARALAARMCA